MTQFTLPSSPNWYQSGILVCNDDGLVAYGSRTEISIIEIHSDGNPNVSLLTFAHKDKVNVLVFSPSRGSYKNCLATCGDDGMVRVWDFHERRLVSCHSGHKDGLKVMGLDWSSKDYNRLVSINDLGNIVCWDLASNTIRKLHCGIKVGPFCLACCPHDEDLIAIGFKGGVTLVFDIKGTGKIIHRLRGHEQDVTSISWCPVPYNVIKHKKCVDTSAGGDSNETGRSNLEVKRPRELLLATGGANKHIFIWRTSSDGRYEVVLHLPQNTMTTNSRHKSYAGSNMFMMWTCVLWVDAYTLLSTSQYGELLSWDLNKVFSESTNNKKPQPRLLHSRHYKGCFSIATPVLYDVVTDWQKEKRTVWTTAIDKRVIGCTLGTGDIKFDIPTLGGVVYSMAISPLDPNRLAIGCSDNRIFIWNTSDLSTFNITAYWKNIIGKVMTVCWHPSEENWLAYGTGDGHVGMIDVGSNKNPTLFRLHHRKSVYRVVWAPPILKSEKVYDESKPVLYSIGDGDVLQYTANPLEPNEVPKSLNAAVLNSIDQSLGLKKPVARSEIVFKPDFTCFAVGSENGSVYILSCETLAVQRTIYAHNVLINNIEWHPATVASDNNISPYKDWLATSSLTIKVYNVPSGTEGKAEMVATLSGHSEKIVGLAWSPHFNARLLSASYDSTVQVWDVLSQSCIGVFLNHNTAVMTAIFNPLDPDIAISGSWDNTVRFWSISEHPAPTTKPDKKKSRLQNIMKERTEVEEATDPAVEMSLISKEEDKIGKHENQNGTVSTSSNRSKKTREKGKVDCKNPQKSQGVFTDIGPKLVQAKHFEVMLQRWTTSHAPTSASLSPTEEEPSGTELDYLDFFGDDKAMKSLLMVEESKLKQLKQPIPAQESALWRGDVSQMIKEAITKKQLSEWVLSVAPLAGFGIWEEACEAYVNQLVECGEVSKASYYLLAIHKVHEAIRLLADYKRYKEAIAIATCRLEVDDPLTAQVYTEWGDMTKHYGSFLQAAQYYLAGNNTQACIETLVRLKELRYLKMATTLAKHVGQTELANSLAEECLTKCLKADNFSVAHQLIAEMPQFQYWVVWVRACELLAKVKNHSESNILGWLEGRREGQLSVCGDLTTACSAIGPVYHKLLPYLPTNKTPDFERDVWLYVSGQLVAACAARLEVTTVQFLRHLVSALSAAFHFQTNHPQSLALLIILSVIAPAGLFAEESIISTAYKTTEESQLMKSVKSFVCASVVHWMANNLEKVTSLCFKSEKSSVENHSENGTKDHEEYKISWLLELLTNCSADVLDSENISFSVCKAQKEELFNVVTKENILKHCTKEKVESEKNASKYKLVSSKTETVIEKTDGNKSKLEGLVTIDNTDEKEAKKIDDNLSIDSENKGICNSDKHLRNITHEDGPSKTAQMNQAQNTDVIESNPSGAGVNINNREKDECEVKPNVTYNKAMDNSCNDFQQETKYKINQINPLQTAMSNKIEKADFVNLLCAKTNLTFVDSSLQQNEPSNTSVVVDTSVNNNEQIGELFNRNREGDIQPINNGSDHCEESIETKDKKIQEIVKLDDSLQTFEATRVSVPCPFTAYVNIKFLIENLVRKLDVDLAESLQEHCDQIWKKHLE